MLKIDFFVVAGIRPRRFSIGPCRTIRQPKFWASTFYNIKAMPSFRPKSRTFLPRKKCESGCLWKNCKFCWRLKKILMKICEIYRAGKKIEFTPRDIYRLIISPLYFDLISIFTPLYASCSCLSRQITLKVLRKNRNASQ